MYKFIGTDEQLLINGFTLIKGDLFFIVKRSYKGYQVSIGRDNSF